MLLAWVTISRSGWSSIDSRAGLNPGLQLQTNVPPEPQRRPAATFLNFKTLNHRAELCSRRMIAPFSFLLFQKHLPPTHNCAHWNFSFDYFKNVCPRCMIAPIGILEKWKIWRDFDHNENASRCVGLFLVDYGLSDFDRAVWVSIENSNVMSSQFLSPKIITLLPFQQNYRNASCVYSLRGPPEKSEKTPAGGRRKSANLLERLQNPLFEIFCVRPVFPTCCATLLSGKDGRRRLYGSWTWMLSTTTGQVPHWTSCRTSFTEFRHRLSLLNSMLSLTDFFVFNGFSIRL